MNLASQVDQMEPDGIQLLVNNAGIARDDNTKFSTAGQPDMNDVDSIHNHFIKSDPQAWEDTFRTNVTGQYFTSIAFLPLLAKGGKKTKVRSYSYTGLYDVLQSGFLIFYRPRCGRPSPGVETPNCISDSF